MDEKDRLKIKTLVALAGIGCANFPKPNKKPLNLLISLPLANGAFLSTVTVKKRNRSLDIAGFLEKASANFYEYRSSPAEIR